MLIPLRRTPRVWVADDFVSRDECEHILASAADAERLAAAGVTTRHDHSGFWFDLPIAGDAVAAEIARRTCDALGLENDFGTTLRFRRYEPGESHPAHVDCFTNGDSHLVATALVYLTDTEAGGETVFPRALPEPLIVRPARGRLVAWLNYYPNGALDPSSFHESRAIVSGTKATITNFIYAPLDCAGARPGVR